MPVSAQESLAEVWVNSGMLQGQGHWIQQSWELWLDGIGPFEGGCHHLLCEICSVVSNSLWLHGLYSPWNSPGQNTGLGSLSLLQGIFPSQGLNPWLLHCRQILYQLSHQGGPLLPLPLPEFGLTPNYREGTHPCLSAENWIKDLLSMALPSRARPRFTHSQYLPSGSFCKPLILIHQRADRMKPPSQKINQNWSHGSQSCLTWNYEPCHVGPPKMGGSWWTVLTKCDPLEKGMANHLSILALRTPWTVWKGKNEKWSLEQPISETHWYHQHFLSCWNCLEHSVNNPQPSRTWL